MDFKDFSGTLQKFWTPFRKTIYFRALLLLLLSVLAVLLLQSPIVCISLVLIPVTILLIPHWFGEKSVKNHAVNGIAFLVLATVLYAAIVTPNFLSAPQQVQAYGLDLNGAPAAANLTEGQVTPFVGAPDTAFNFTVRMASRNASAWKFVVAAQIVSAEGLDTVVPQFYPMRNDTARGGNLSAGQYYYLNMTLPAKVHEFNFEVFPSLTAFNATTNPVVGTLGSFGPHNASFGTHFLFWLYRGAFWMIFLTFGFFVLLLLYWWTRKAREIRGARASAPEPGKRAEGGGEFTCTNCGADVAEGDAKCPKCGAVFEAEAPDEPADAKA